MRFSPICTRFLRISVLSLAGLMLALGILTPQPSQAQGLTLYSVSTDDALLRVIDPFSGATLSSVTITFAGDIVDGATGLAPDCAPRGTLPTEEVLRLGCLRISVDAGTILGISISGTGRSDELLPTQFVSAIARALVQRSAAGLAVYRGGDLDTIIDSVEQRINQDATDRESTQTKLQQLETALQAAVQRIQALENP